MKHVKKCKIGSVLWENRTWFQTTNGQMERRTGESGTETDSWWQLKEWVYILLLPVCSSCNGQYSEMMMTMTLRWWAPLQLRKNTGSSESSSTFGVRHRKARFKTLSPASQFRACSSVLCAAGASTWLMWCSYSWPGLRRRWTRWHVPWATVAGARHRAVDIILHHENASAMDTGLSPSLPPSLPLSLPLSFPPSTLP